MTHKAKLVHLRLQYGSNDNQYQHKNEFIIHTCDHTFLYERLCALNLEIK